MSRSVFLLCVAFVATTSAAVPNLPKFLSNRQGDILSYAKKLTREIDIRRERIIEDCNNFIENVRVGENERRDAIFAATDDFTKSLNALLKTKEIQPYEENQEKDCFSVFDELYENFSHQTVVTFGCAMTPIIEARNNLTKYIDTACRNASNNHLQNLSLQASVCKTKLSCNKIAKEAQDVDVQAKNCVDEGFQKYNEALLIIKKNINDCLKPNVVIPDFEKKITKAVNQFRTCASKQPSSN